jgi:hypothetical protein
MLYSCKLLTLPTTEWRTPPKWRTLPRPHLFPSLLTMLQQPDLELLSCVERITLAIKAIKSNASLSQQRAAAVYNVPETTL